MVTYELTRLGVVMTPDPDDPREAWGVLNPASARTPDGELWLYPRLVAEGNCSRVGLARVRVDDDGTPVGVERLGVVLEPEEHWETHAGGGGVEDPRITHLPELDRWVMTYTAYGPLGARIGMATSDDLRHWERLGPVTFAYEPRWRTDFNLYSNKDALWFPEPVPGPTGSPPTRCCTGPCGTCRGSGRGRATSSPTASPSRVPASGCRTCPPTRCAAMCAR